MIDPLNLRGTNKYMSREQLLLNMENGQKLQRQNSDQNT